MTRSLLRRLGKTNIEIGEEFNIIEESDHVTTYLVKTNRADFRRDIQRAIEGIKPDAFKASIMIRGGRNVTLEEATLAIGEICTRLPPKALLVWGLTRESKIHCDGMEIRCVVGYKKGG